MLNKVYSRRFDFENQSKMFAKDRHKYEQNIAKCDAKLNLLQSLNGQEWHDAIEATGGYQSLSIADKKEQVHGKLRAKLEKEIQEQQIAIEDYRLKCEISSQENIVLKQTLEWVQERFDCLFKRWHQLSDKIGQGHSLQQLLQFSKQVLQTDSKIRKRRIHQNSDESISIGGLMLPNDQKVSAHSAIEAQAKGGGGYSEIQA